MKLRNKFLLLLCAVGLTFGSASANQLNCFAVRPAKPLVRAVFVGNVGSGKSWIISCLADGNSVAERKIDRKTENKKIYFRDTAEQDECRESVLHIDCRDSDAVLIVLRSDTIDKMQENFEKWYNGVIEVTGVPVFVLVNTDYYSMVDDFTDDTIVSEDFDTNAKVFIDWIMSKIGKGEFSQVKDCREINPTKRKNIVEARDLLAEIEPKRVK